MWDDLSFTLTKSLWPFWWDKMVGDRRGRKASEEMITVNSQKRTRWLGQGGSSLDVERLDCDLFVDRTNRIYRWIRCGRLKKGKNHRWLPKLWPRHLGSWRYRVKGTPKCLRKHRQTSREEGVTVRLEKIQRTQKQSQEERISKKREWPLVLNGAAASGKRKIAK